LGRGRVALISVHGGPLAETGAENAGGQNVYVREVALALHRLGFDVEVFTRGLHHVRPELRDLAGVRVVRLPAGPPGPIGRDELYEHLPEFLAGVRRYYWTRNCAPDVVHTNYWLSGWVGMAFTSLLGMPQVHTHHSLGAVKYACLDQLPPVASRRLQTERELLAHCRGVVATCQQDIESMRFYGGSPRTFLVPCGVDERLFSPRQARGCRTRLGIPEELPVLAYVGRMHPQKGVETFIRAAARVAEPHQLLLAGEGEELERMRRLTDQLHLRATFLGKVEHSRLPLVYGAADVCVVPSHYESFGMVALEAMACGRPVVASAVGGLRFNVVHGRTGLLAPARDEAAFARCIEQLLVDRGLREDLGRSAASYVGRAYTWRSVADSLASVYEQVQAA